MMGVYARGKKLWIRFRDAAGKWRDSSTGFDVGQEELAQVMHDETVARIAAATRTVKHAPPRAVTPCLVKLRQFGEVLAQRTAAEALRLDRGNNVRSRDRRFYARGFTTHCTPTL